MIARAFIHLFITRAARWEGRGNCFSTQYAGYIFWEGQPLQKQLKVFKKFLLQRSGYNPEICWRCLRQLTKLLTRIILPITTTLISRDIFPSLLDTKHLYIPLSDGTAVLILKYHLVLLNLRWKLNHVSANMWLPRMHVCIIIVTVMHEIRFNYFKSVSHCFTRRRMHFDRSYGSSMYETIWRNLTSLSMLLLGLCKTCRAIWMTWNSDRELISSVYLTFFVPKDIQATSVRLNELNVFSHSPCSLNYWST